MKTNNEALDISWAEYCNKFQENLRRTHFKDIISFIDILWNAFLLKERIFIIGNGGSASLASHFAQDLVKATIDLNKPTGWHSLHAVSLCDNISFITAIANDDGYEKIFSNQLKLFYPKKDDILIAISGSGNSKNILNCVELAHEYNMTTVGITGFDGGQLNKLAQNKVHVKNFDMRQTESSHSLILHFVVEQLLTRIDKYLYSK